jgi:tellurite resistance protein TerC
MDVAWWAWAVFLGLILTLLALDLFVLHRTAHELSLKEAAIWSAVWISMGLGFCLVVFMWQGRTAGGEYLTAYLVEESLSVDNIFVFALLFSYFSVPAQYQHRLLFWGILGAILFRGVFIFAGISLLHYFHWVFYVFGAFLIYTAVKMARAGDVQVDPGNNSLLKIFRRVVPMTAGYRGQAFLVREAGRWIATPLLAVLIVVESTDVLFATDSIPAVFGVTQHAFLIFTSNIFAILGLRTLYFLLARLMAEMRYLKTGLAIILGFVGIKMLASAAVEIPIWVSLAVIGVVLFGAGIFSVLASRREKRRRELDGAAAQLASADDPDRTD